MKKSKQTEKADYKNLPEYYVGVGASAGGLEALEELLSNMPVDTNMSIIIVQHLSPDYKSMMVELLARKTQMPVVQIEDGMVIEKGKVYLVPPKKNLEIYQSKLILIDQPRHIGLNLPIDKFFKSLALDQGKRAIGIILSGTGSDGSSGIRAIKENGGMVMVQDITTAKFDGMPKSAIATGLVDYIIAASKMSEALIKFIRHPLVIQTKNEELSKEETFFLKVLGIIRTELGTDFSYYKPTTLIRRIERRISVNQIENQDDYINLLLSSPEEIEILAREFLIGVTRFFRDEEAFRQLEEKAIPEIFSNTRQNQEIRIWCVPCSTGEEAYSIAILCCEYMDKHDIQADIKIFATDLDKEAIKYAGLGIYNESIVSDISNELLGKYFTKEHDSFRIIDKVRKMVIFSQHNVINDPPFSKIDLISCRNLLIYLKQSIQEQLITLFQYSLVKNGILLLGNSETLAEKTPEFDVIDSKQRIYRYNESIKSYRVANLLEVKSKNLAFSGEQNYSKRAQLNYRNDYSGELIPFEKLANLFAPAGAIVDKNNNVVHLFKNIKEYIQFPEGKPTYNIGDIISPQLKMVVLNMLFKVSKDNKEVVMNKVTFSENGKSCYLNINVKPLNFGKNYPDYYLITIEKNVALKKQETNEGIETEYNFNDQAAERIKELEKEIQFREESLQTTVEELETSNEELQATNEELVSSNEELQSTNEELQSLNEELYTVNSQYQEKIDELTTLNNDINNLLENTDIGTLFLDSNQKVRKYTANISKIVNIMDVDLGRPFSHLTLNSDYDNIYKDVEKVLETLQATESEIQTRDGEWYLVTIKPYRHTDRSIHGVIITMVNVTKLHMAQLQFKKLFQTISQGVVYQDADGKITRVNPAAEKILGMTAKQMMGLTSDAPDWQAIKENGEALPGSQHPSMIALRTGEQVNNFVMGVVNAKLKKRKWISVNATPLFNDTNNEVTQVYTTFTDITQEYVNQIALERTLNELKISKNKYDLLFNSLDMAFAYHEIILDNNNEPIDYKFIKVNKYFEDITGLKAKDIVNKNVKHILPNIEEFWIKTYGKVALNNTKKEFTYFSSDLNKHFKVRSYSPIKGYFVTLFSELDN